MKSIATKSCDKLVVALAKNVKRMKHFEIVQKNLENGRLKLLYALPQNEMRGNFETLISYHRHGNSFHLNNQDGACKYQIDLTFEFKSSARAFQFCCSLSRFSYSLCISPFSSVFHALKY